MLVERLRAIRHASYVERCHTEMTLGPKQTLGHHQYNVAMMARLITDGEASTSLICACLDHDIPEHISGDSPGHTKLAYPDLKEALEAIEENFYLRHGVFFHRGRQLLYEDEQIVLKLADGLELLYYCMEQRMLGNRWISDMYCQMHRILMEIPLPKKESWKENFFEIKRFIEQQYARAG